jgi:hypothetical protein
MALGIYLKVSSLVSPAIFSPEHTGRKVREQCPLQRQSFLAKRHESQYGKKKSSLLFFPATAHSKTLKNLILRLYQRNNFIVDLSSSCQ